MSKIDQKLKIETLALHGGQEAGPDDGLTGGADLSDHLVSVQKHRARGESFWPQRIRQYLHAADESDDGCALKNASPRWMAAWARWRWQAGNRRSRWRCLNIAQAGDEIVSADNLYGGTYNLFHYTFPRLGVKVKFVKSNDLAAFQKAITPKTKAIYAEIIGNPETGCRGS